MQKKYKYPAINKDALFRASMAGLFERVDSSDEMYDRYKQVIENEIEEIKKIGFDGYMLLLADVVLISKEISGFVSAFGSVQNSLTAYVLGIVDFYDFEPDNFKNFTPFVKKPTVNIVISNYANAGCMGYIKHKYKEIIKKTKKRTIIFKDDLKIKFIDLGIETRVKEEAF